MGKKGEESEADWKNEKHICDVIRSRKRLDEIDSYSASRRMYQTFKNKIHIINVWTISCLWKR